MVISRRTYEEKEGGGGREGEEMIETEKKNERFFQPNPMLITICCSGMKSTNTTYSKFLGTR